MTEGNLVIIVGAIVTIVGLGMPIFSVWMQNRNLRIVKAEDYARQDEVAIRVEAAARQAQESNRRMLKLQADTQGQLKVIHTFVNSNLTAAKQSEYGSMTRELAIMSEMVAMKQVQGQEPTAAVLDAIISTKANIETLRVELSARLEATKLVEKQTDVQIEQIKMDVQNEGALEVTEANAARIDKIEIALAKPAQGGDDAVKAVKV